MDKIKEIQERGKVDCAARRKLYNIESGTTSPEVPYMNKRSIKRQKKDDMLEDEAAQSIVLTRASLRELLEAYKKHGEEGGKHRFLSVVLFCQSKNTVIQ